MKRIPVLFFLCLSFVSFGQSKEDEMTIKKNSLTVGFLQGGGALIGVDYERMFYENLSIQIGGGYVGLGASLLYHFEPTVDSSAIGLTYLSQGVPGSSDSQQAAGVTYVFRAFGWLTGQLGLGYVTFRGEGMEEFLKKQFNSDPPPIMALYSIGTYFSF